jgi:RNA polymerase sigma factor FliA
MVKERGEPMTTHLRIVPPEGSALTPEQRDLVRMGMPLVERCVASVAGRCADLVTREELLGVGVIALSEAAIAYHVDRHPSFPHYAHHHVYGRLLDAVRTEHFSPRARIEHAMSRAFSRILSHHSLALDIFNGEPEDLLDEAERGCADVLAATLFAGLLDAEAQSPEDAFVEREEYLTALGHLRDAQRALRPHELEVVKLVHERGMTLDEVGREIGVHPSTVQRRHASALRRMRATLEERGVIRALAPLDAEAPPSSGADTRE